MWKLIASRTSTLQTQEPVAFEQLHNLLCKGRSDFDSLHWVTTQTQERHSNNWVRTATPVTADTRWLKARTVLLQSPRGLNQWHWILGNHQNQNFILDQHNPLKLKLQIYSNYLHKNVFCIFMLPVQQREPGQVGCHFSFSSSFEWILTNLNRSRQALINLVGWCTENESSWRMHSISCVLWT